MLRSKIIAATPWWHLSTTPCAFQSTASVEKASTSKAKPVVEVPSTYVIRGSTFKTEPNYTNCTPRVVALTERQLLHEKGSALRMLKARIEHYFHTYYRSPFRRSPLFAVVDNMHPVVTLQENFDSLLVPPDHVSRQKSDSYYINRDLLLRAHTSAHQHQLMQQGLDDFLCFGDVYRRDTIDRTHYPAFHQLEGVRLFTREQLFAANSAQVPRRAGQSDESKGGFQLFEPEPDATRQPHKQERLTFDATAMLELNLKCTLEDFARSLFGKDTKFRWVDCYFPFTHPSWELEIWHNDDWLELLGCGIMEQQLLDNAGVGRERVGWAFGIGLERVAMRLYNIPDIRLFWSRDTGVTSQFTSDDPLANVQYKTVSKAPQCVFDLSFWLPEYEHTRYTPNDFYDLVRDIGGDLVEQVNIVDEFFHPKKRRHSHTYRIVYRHSTRALTKDEVNVIHKRIEEAAVENLKAEIR